MKLAEALIRRSDLNRRIQETTARLYANLQVEEGEEPNEDPKALLDEVTHMQDELRELIDRINRTNHLTPFMGSHTIAEALVQRDYQDQRAKFLLSLAQQSQRQRREPRFGDEEPIRYVPLLDHKELRKEADTIAAVRRAVDVKLQQLNWLTDLED